MTALPPRSGTRPETRSTIPHSQLDQQPADARHLDRLLAEAAGWPGVRLGESGISVEGARALILDKDLPG